MTLQNIKEWFEARYKIECQKRKIEPIGISNFLMAQNIAEAQQDIQRRLLVVQTSTTISMISGTQTYDLPTNFGKHKLVLWGDSELKEIGINEINKATALSGNPGYFAIITNYKPQIKVYPVPTSGTLTVYYYVDSGYFSPEGGTTQNFGTINSDGSLSGNSILPERYNKAILLYLLGMFFEDYEVRYEKEIILLRSAKVETIPDTIGYSMAGFDNETMNYIGVDSNISTGGSSGGSSSTDNDPIVKLLRIEMTYGNTPIIKKQIGFNETFGSSNITISGTTITISSTNSEFNNNMYVDINNRNIMYSMTNSETILSLPEADYGTIVITIWEK